MTWLERGTLRGRLELVIAPGPVLLRLARRGFGVLLPEPDARVDGAMPR